MDKLWITSDRTLVEMRDDKKVLDLDTINFNISHKCVSIHTCTHSMDGDVENVVRVDDGTTNFLCVLRRAKP